MSLYAGINLHNRIPRKAGRDAIGGIGSHADGLALSLGRESGDA